MRVLVTGAGGYIGGRLVPALLARGHEVVATFSTGVPPAGLWWTRHVEVRAMDVLVEEQVRLAVADVEAAYYLIHGLGGVDFSATDRLGARTMAAAAASADVERIVYLSGLVPDVPAGELSEHLTSRWEVERILAASGVPTITARAAVVIGSGSTSFEILRHLSERVPVQAVPTWMRSTVQPIAVVDVVEALAGCLDGPARTRTYDVGGPERLPYPELLRRYAEVARIVRPQLPMPFFPPAAVGLLAGRVTGAPSPTVASLVASLHHDMVCRDDSFAEELLPDGHRLLGVRESMTRALTRPRAGTPVRERDPMGPLPSDPTWTGGDVYLFDGEARHRPRTLVRRALLGVRRPW